MKLQAFGQMQRNGLRPSRAASALIFALVCIVLLLAGAAAPARTAAGQVLAQCSPGTPYPGCFSILTGLPTVAAMGDGYSLELRTTDCQDVPCSFLEPKVFSLQEGTLPPGLTLTSHGVLSGILAAPGDYSFLLHVEKGCLYGSRCYAMTVTGVNQPPSFTPGGNVTVVEDDPPYNATWATNIQKGGLDEGGQALTFHVSNDNPALFSVQPAIAANGALSFTLGPDRSGVANLAVFLEDNGGVADGGNDRSPTVTFRIEVTPTDLQPGPTFYVNSTAWTGMDNACTDEDCTLREAINAANRYRYPETGVVVLDWWDVIYSIDGVDNASAEDGPTGLPVITGDVRINGRGGHIRRSDSAPYARLFHVAHVGYLILDDVHLENGKLDPSLDSSKGGAILNEGWLKIKRSYIGENSARYGGAIFNYDPPPSWALAEMYNNTFYKNSAQDGAIRSLDSLTLLHNTFFDNLGAAGSAIAIPLGGGYMGGPWLTSFNNLFVASGPTGPLCYFEDAAKTHLDPGGNLATDSSCPGSRVTSLAALKLILPPYYNGGFTRNIALDYGSSAIDVALGYCRDPARFPDMFDGHDFPLDQRGGGRPLDGNHDFIDICDVGSYEKYWAIMAPPPAGPETDPPQVFVRLTPQDPDGANGWYRGPVTLRPEAQDASPVIDARCALDPQVAPTTYDALPAELCPFLGGAPVNAEGAHKFYAAVVDKWGNESEVTLTQFQIDATPPIITCPAGGPFLLGSGPQPVGPAGVDAGVAGLDAAASTLGGTVATDSIGAKTLTFTAVDLAGNSTEKQCTYNVVYDFAGFDPPVEPAPALNEAKAGQAVPLKFSLAGDQGLEIIAAGYPASRQVDCESKAPTGPLEVADQPGKSDLSYDPETGWYSYGWKTDKGWAGTCRSLALQLADGTEHMAYFQFK